MEHRIAREQKALDDAQGLSTWIVALIALNGKFGLNRLMQGLFAKEEICKPVTNNSEVSASLMRQDANP